MAAISAVPEPTKFAILPFFDIFAPRLVSDDTANGHTEVLFPESSIRDNQNGPLTFTIKGTSDWIDFFHTKLYIRGEFRGSFPDTSAGATAGATIDIKDASKPFFSHVNLLPHALFKTVEVSVNSKTITNNDPNYMYKAFAHFLLNYNRDSLETDGANNGWLKDQGSYDGIDPTKNPALEIRRNNITGNMEAFYLIDIITPLFQSGRFLLSELDVNIMLRKNDNPAFYMMHADDAQVDFHITETRLNVRKITPKPELALAIQQHLAKIGPAAYVLPDPRVIVSSVQTGETFIHREYATLGHHPRRIIAFMVETDAYNGKGNKNPFNFQHFNLAKATLTENGIEYPTPPLQTNFTQGDFVEAYSHLLSSLQADKRPIVPYITKTDFKNGCFVLSWDMSADQFGGDNPQSLINRTANIKLSLEFRTALQKAITLIFIYMLESRTIITAARQITHETIS